MARKVVERIYWVSIADSETLDGCRIRIKTNIPMKVLQEFEESGQTVRAGLDFLSIAIVDWEGFDLPCERASFGELDAQEIMELTRLVNETIQNPPKATSADS